MIGCSINLDVPEIKFMLNGQTLDALFRNFNVDGYFFPVISTSSKVSCRFKLGGNQVST